MVERLLNSEEDAGSNPAPPTNSIDILYLSHCVPNPPDKGERIRAYHEVKYLAATYRLHLACFARTPQEAEWARRLSDRCASVHVELLRPVPALARSAARFLLGGCLTASFFDSRPMRRYLEFLCRRVPLRATVAYSSVVASFAPSNIPLLLDLVDVDSEKWLAYAEFRRPGLPYLLESQRLRRLEINFAQRAECTVLSTQREEELLCRFARPACTLHMENGVDFEHFDPRHCPPLPELNNRRLIVFVGTMDYYPNLDAVRWFSRSILPALRSSDSTLEFLIVGRNPAAKLAKLDGVTVTGAVPDVRPYLAAAWAVVSPLRIARGMPNKVIEALAMGKCVFASTESCLAFGPHLPHGIIRCDSEQEFVHAILKDGRYRRPWDPAIRGQARGRFSWEANLEPLGRKLDTLLRPNTEAVRSAG